MVGHIYFVSDRIYGDSRGIRAGVYSDNRVGSAIDDRYIVAAAIGDIDLVGDGIHRNGNWIWCG